MFFSSINTSTFFIQIASISGFLAVALGAFGAHGFKNVLDTAMMEIYQTAVLYHFLHTLALLAVAIFMLQKVGHSTALLIAAWGFVIGLLIFSGSLYTLSLTGIKVLGAITPIGGVAFLIAWSALFWAAFKAAE